MRLARCPCGEVPVRLLLQQSGVNVLATCDKCDDYGVVFPGNIAMRGCYEAAVEKWNKEADERLLVRCHRVLKEIDRLVVFDHLPNGRELQDEIEAILSRMDSPTSTT